MGLNIHVGTALAIVQEYMAARVVVMILIFQGGLSDYIRI